MKLSLHFLLCLVPCFCWSQIPSNPIGSNPPGLKWKQINTDRVQIIFPEELGKAALRVAHLSHHLWDMDQPQVSTIKKKIPIVMHGLTVRSNAFVTVGPYRSEFFSITPQFKTTENWIDHLTIHEYRHVQQINNTQQGITNLGRKILGSWTWGGMFGLVLPRWYFEGDAVIAETGLSKAGRGRFPEFTMQHHALMRDTIHYSYEKASARSYKDFVPSWYPLGYNMLAYGRKIYGPNLWQEVASDAVKYKGLFYPFGRSLKKKTGLNPSRLYDATMADLSEEWKRVDLSKEELSTQINKREKSTFTHYSAPVVIGDGSIACYKSGFDQLRHIVRIDEEGTESRITSTGILLDGALNTLSYSTDKLVWAELGWDSRWRYKNYSELVIYDMTTKRKSRIKGQRYFSPSLSMDASQIAVVHIENNLDQSIRILDVNSGKIEAEWTTEYPVELSYPSWTSENTIAFIRTDNQENQIMEFDVANNISNKITDPSIQHISHLDYSDGRIYYAKANEGVSDIFSIDVSGNSETKISTSIIGAFQPAVDLKGGKIYYSQYHSEGYNIHSMSLPIKPMSKSRDIPEIQSYYVNLAKEEGGDILQKPTTEEFEVKEFKSTQGLFNFHSILPQWTPPEFSLTVLTDNTFGTLSGSLGMYYNYNEDELTYGGRMRYAQFYPILDGSYFQSNRNALYINFNGLTDTSFTQSQYIQSWKENRATIGVTLPYNFSQGNMLNNISIRGAYQYNSISTDPENTILNEVKDTLATTPSNLSRLSEIFQNPLTQHTLHTLDVNLRFSMLRLRAFQQMRTRLGVSMTARYRFNIGEEALGGNNFLARALFYLPGLKRNHSLSFDGMYMKEDALSQYRYSDLFVYPRGYNVSLRRDRFAKLSVNYRFPIIYPDLALSGWAFFKRLKGNIFYDYGTFLTDQFPLERRQSNVSSLGFELGFDVRVLRLLEVDFGVRYSYLLNEDFASNGRNQFDFFVISISE